jgi:hypothetical protein
MTWILSFELAIEIPKFHTHCVVGIPGGFHGGTNVGPK